MKLVTAIFLILVFTIMPTLAQDTTKYEDPAGRFSVPIPPKWTDESTPEVGRFVSPDDIAVSVLAIEAADAKSGDQAILTAIIPELAGSSPVQTSTQPGSNGTWTVNIFVSASGRFIVLASQWINGVTYALLFDLPSQDALVANQGEILSFFNGFTIGKRLDLTGVKAKPFTDEMLTDLKAYIEDARQRFHVPGVSIAVVQNGGIVYSGGFGTTEPDGGQPVTSDTLFMIGSTTKSMTTMMMGTLVDEGVLDWNQPVTDILPSFALSNPAATPHIRLRDLLNMSSGVPRYDQLLSLAHFTPQELIASLATIPMVAAPGVMWNYSNQMVTTGGYLSAMAAGSPMDGLYEGYVKLVQQRVFDPIGMTHSTFDFEAATTNPNHALPYIYDPATQKYIAVSLNDEGFTGNVAPAGGVWSNVEDMVRYLQTELSSGISPDGKRVISEATLRMTQSPEITPAGPFEGYGMGWIIERYNGLPLVWHGGNTKGFTSDLAFLPSANLGVVILTNAGDANNFYKSVRQYAFELAFGLEHDVSKGMVAAQEAQEVQMQAVPIPTVTPINPEIVAPYLGVYDYGVTLELRGHELWLVGAFAQTPLYPAPQPGEYSGTGVYSSLHVRFAGTDSQHTLEVMYPDNLILTLKAISSAVSQSPTGVMFPKLTGSFQVGKMEYHLTDAGREEIFTDDPNDKRELMVTVYYPGQPEANDQAAPYINDALANALGINHDIVSQIHPHAYAEVPVSKAQTSYPVIVFSPGMGNLPQFYSVTFEDLASHGYIVVSIAHPYSTAITVFPNDSIVLANEAGSQLHTDSEAADAIVRAKILGVWVGDERFVLNQLEQMDAHDPLLGGHLDLTKVGVFGHSLGGETAIETASLDSRIQAALSLDSQVTGSVLEDGLPKPFMILRSERLSVTDEQLQAAGSTREQFEAAYAAMDAPINALYGQAKTGYRLTLHGSTHNTYTTDYLLLAALFPSEYPPEVIGAIDPTRAVDIIDTYVVAFFDKHLKGEAVPLIDAPSLDYPEVTFERHEN